jgi:hypothetical protein
MSGANLMLESHLFQVAQKGPDARPPQRFSPADQAGNPEE